MLASSSRRLSTASAVAAAQALQSAAVGNETAASAPARVRIPYSELGMRNALQLPRLPLPPLSDTLERYEASLRGLDVSDADRDAHLERARRFFAADGSAQHLQRHIENEAMQNAAAGRYPHTFVEELWDDMYLRHRGPAAPAMVPALALKPLGGRIRELIGGSTGINQERANGSRKPDMQCYTAAYLVHGLLRFARKINEEGIDVAANQPFDFHALTKQFGFTRTPTRRNGSSEPPKDGLSVAPLGEAMGHVVVMHRGHVFRVATRDRDGGYYHPEQLARSFREVIVSTREVGEAEFPVGALTGVDRDTWADARHGLVECMDTNAKWLKEIDSAFTVVCLDSEPWGDDQSKILRGMLGGASKSDVVSRWYDKHMLIVDPAPHGRAAWCFEHSFSDGMVWSRYIDEVVSDLLDETSSADDYAPLGPLRSTLIDAQPPVPFRMDWMLGARDSDLSKAVAKAVNDVSQQVDGVTHAPVSLPFGKRTISKKLRLSPDAFCQAAFHLAYHRTHGAMAPTYESCSTGTFFHGRTETLRTATAPMRELCRTFREAGSGNARDASSEQRDKLRELVRRVSAEHVRLAKEASTGRGVDRHLLALRSALEGGAIAGVKGDDGHAFFQDPLFTASSARWLMTTSNISKPFVDWFNFAPVEQEGYGLGYTIDDASIRTAVSAFSSSDATDASHMGQAVEQAALDLLSIHEER